jgi:hypothetical protein
MTSEIVTLREGCNMGSCRDNTRYLTSFDSRSRTTPMY